MIEEVTTLVYKVGNREFKTKSEAEKYDIFVNHKKEILSKYEIDKDKLKLPDMMMSYLTHHQLTLMSPDIRFYSIKSIDDFKEFISSLTIDEIKVSHINAHVYHVNYMTKRELIDNISNDLSECVGYFPAIFMVFRFGKYGIFDYKDLIEISDKIVDECDEFYVQNLKFREGIEEILLDKGINK